MFPPRLFALLGGVFFLVATSSALVTAEVNVEARSPPGFKIVVAPRRRTARSVDVGVGVGVGVGTAAVEGTSVGKRMVIRRGTSVAIRQVDGPADPTETADAAGLPSDGAGETDEELEQDAEEDDEEDEAESEEDDEDDEPYDLNLDLLPSQIVGPSGRKPTRAEMEGVVWDEESVARMMFGAGNPKDEVGGSSGGSTAPSA